MKSYLTDWKNLATHAAIGVLLVVVIFVIPIDLIYRIAIFFGVVVFNMARMRYEKKQVEDSVTSDIEQ
jgi:hypothetical protein